LVACFQRAVFGHLAGEVEVVGTGAHAGVDEGTLGRGEWPGAVHQDGSAVQQPVDAGRVVKRSDADR
jgi:hypothetical protein